MNHGKIRTKINVDKRLLFNKREKIRKITNITTVLTFKFHILKNIYQY